VNWRELSLRDGKGGKDRRTMLPEGGRAATSAAAGGAQPR
jgi:hypothetical protein